MTRIALAYNQKPELSASAPTAALESDADDEPPSRGDRRDGVAVATAPQMVDDAFAEWDTVETIDAVASALAPLGDVIRLEADEHFPERLRRERPDLVFNIAEGLYGPNREAHVPAICEFLGVPYSASDPFTLSLCLDKARTKQFLAATGIPTARFALVETEAQLQDVALPFPLFLKPSQEGSSKGITERNFVSSREELLAQGSWLLARYAQPVLVEEFLPGAEFTCGILGNGAQAEVLPLVGMNFGALPAGALPIYGFEAKWIWDQPENPLEIFECPAQIPAALAQRVSAVALAAYRAAGCRDWSRVDVRLDSAGNPLIVEINPLPGILPNAADNSCLPKAARAAGIGYDALIQRCARHAAERLGIAL